MKGFEMDIIWLVIAYLAGAASAEGVRRTLRKATGGTFFTKKPPPKPKPSLTA